MASSGLAVPAAYGGFGVSAPCFALVTEELARGWMSLPTPSAATARSSDLVILGWPGAAWHLEVCMATPCSELRLLAGPRYRTVRT